MKLSKIKPNETNPRFITEDKFKKLVESLKKFPKMMELRPIVVDEDSVIIGGNMRYKALVALGYEEIPNNWVKTAKEFSPEELREFIIKDNVGYGDWDWDALANNWEAENLTEWGVNVPKFEAEVDYSILDEEDVSDKIGELSGGVRKAVQIEFEPEHYDAALEIIKYWRERGLYLGGFLVEKLKEEKEKNV